MKIWSLFFIWAAIPPSVPAFFSCFKKEARKKELHSSRAAGVSAKHRKLENNKEKIETFFRHTFFELK